MAVEQPDNKEDALPVLAYEIDRLLDEPNRLEAMQANARRLARPRAAMELVRTLGRL